MTRIEETTINHEIISALMVAVGMISLMMNALAGLLIILAGAVSLVLVYSYRFISLGAEMNNGGPPVWVHRMNYLILILALGILVTVIFITKGKLAFTVAGVALLVLLLSTDLLLCRKRYFRLNLGYCLLRIMLVMMLLMLFYFFPIR